MGALTRAVFNLNRDLGDNSGTSYEILAPAGRCMLITWEAASSFSIRNVAVNKASGSAHPAQSAVRSQLLNDLHVECCVLQKLALIPQIATSGYKDFAGGGT